MTTRTITAPCGSEVHYLDGLIHRDDGPAVRLVLNDGTIEEQFWQFGREDELSRITIEPTKTL